LVTGGLGVLGLKVADWLAGQGARHLWLVSRRAAAPEQQAAIAEIESLGATLHVVSADISDPDEVAALVARIGTQGPALDGVFHCAGLLDDGIMTEMGWERYHRVTAAKIEGSWALHQATEDLELGHFVMFSSILSVIGSMGQLNYVAGNSFLDALVAYRRGLDLPATAMNWGPWEEAGLATESGERGRAIWRARGTDYIPAGEGIEAMRLTLAQGFDHTVVTLTDWPRFVAQFAEMPPFYQRLAQGGGGAAGRIAVDRSRIMDQLRAAAPGERHGLMAAAIGQICATVLGADAPPAPDLSLREAGLDSLMSITVINDIESVFGTRLAARELLRGPSVSELATMVLEALPDLGEGASGGEAASPDASESPRRAAPVGGAPGAWLVVQRPRPEARIRLICFPFAGGGSAVFDRWGDAFDPAIEIVAVEPPGRLGRINEAPVRTVEEFARGLLPELVQKLDKPYAVLGHCLGGLTLYESLRFLEARGHRMPEHIFVSGARPPSVLKAPGNFERELEERLREFVDYRSGKPVYDQTDEVFAEIVRAFGISESSKMLEIEELRGIVLPTVRAEFEMANRYIYLPEDPFPVPLTCFRGGLDEYFRDIDARIWRKFTDRKFELFTRETGHFAIVEDFDFIRDTIQDRLLRQWAENA
ncbi:MAG TPA: SDR family NAD(P)-dependent oxidoreductase, partial [Thermohalobaculum sp.]|nr:SDR family NAD(P)-dependent oxidoreductase [Thermohalobaculum sp.]